MAIIKVFGHKSPDTDSVCSSIVWAWYLENVRKTPAASYVLGEVNNETKYVLDRFGFSVPEELESLAEGDIVNVVDTTNPDELLDGLENVELTEIVDHHKLGGLRTASPLAATIRHVACTCTVIWQIMKYEGFAEIPKNIAGLMLGAIISDSLNLTSPTTTDLDKKAVAQLSEICGEDKDKLAEEQFEAKSDLDGIAAVELVVLDSKTFEFKGRKVRLSVLETTAPENALKMKDELIDEMKTLKEKEVLDIMMFFVVDILKAEAVLIVPGKDEEALAKKAFHCEISDSVATLPGVVSRKKQIVPSVEKAL